MMKFQRIYIPMVALLLALAGCDSATPDEPETDNGPVVYLEISTRAAHTNGEESVNTDTEDYEDRVHDLALLIFNSDATGGKVAHYFKETIGTGTSAHAFTAEVPAGGRYDFYFVANRPDLKSAMEAVTSRTAMNTLMETARELDAELYLNALSGKGFPMSRVYLNQTITTGGSIYQPLPFRPVVGGNPENCVKLIRVAAKLEVNLQGSDFGVKNIYFRNANRDYTLANPNPYAPSSYFNDNTTDVPLNKKNDNTYIYYMPEAIIPSAVWNAVTHHKPVNYFTIVTNSGMIYDIPIISNETSIANGYLAKAMGNDAGFTPQYTINRNDHYKYTIKNLEKIEIVYSVNPWEVIDKAIFMGYGYNVEVEGSTVTVYNTIGACSPHQVSLVTRGGITFSDGSTRKDFTALAADASLSFELNAEPPTGYGPYLDVYYIDVDPGSSPVYTFYK